MRLSKRSKRHSLVTLLATLVRHQPIHLAAQTAADELNLNLPSLKEPNEPTTDSPPGNQLRTILGNLLNPVEHALLATAKTPAQLSARLTDLAAFIDTERAARAASFNRIIFPLLLGTTFFFLLGFLGFPSFMVWIIEQTDNKSFWGNEEIITLVSWYRILFLVFLVTTGIVLFLLRGRTKALLARLPGTEKILRTADGALASQMLAAQLDAGIQRAEALTTIQRTLHIPLTPNRKTDPLLSQLISGETTDAADCRDLHQLLSRRLQNTSAIRLTWIPSAIFWMIIAFFFSFGVFSAMLNQLMW